MIRQENLQFMCILDYVFTFVILHNIKYFLRRLYIFLRSLFTSEIKKNLRNVNLRCIDGKIEGVKNNYFSPRMMQRLISASRIAKYYIQRSWPNITSVHYESEVGLSTDTFNNIRLMRPESKANNPIPRGLRLPPRTSLGVELNGASCLGVIVILCSVVCKSKCE